MTNGLHTVHVRINEAATGKPTPVRLRCTGPDGTYYAPFGRQTEFDTATPSCDVGGNVQLGGKNYSYIDGACEIRLPAGPVHVEVHKGPEYQPLDREVSLGIGQMALRLTIERRADLRQERWYSGDTGCTFLSPHAALLEGTAEGLAVVNLLALEQAAGFSNLLAFSGQKSALESPECQVVVNTLNQHAALGSLGLLNCHRIVYPLRSGTLGLDDWTLADWCDQCHRKGGLVVWHTQPDISLFSGEAFADVVLGKIDALEIRDEVPEQWYTLLDAGFALPLVGSAQKMSNGQVLGSCRTYARLKPAEEFNYKNWIEAVRVGRTFITHGPLLLLTVNDQDPGAMIEDPGRTVRVRVEVKNPLASDRLEIVLNGAIVAERILGDDVPAVLETEVAEGGWIVARYRANEKSLAHTSPVYLRLADRPPRVVDKAVAALLGHLETMIEWVRREGRFESDKQREDLAGVFRHAREQLQQRIGAKR